MLAKTGPPESGGPPNPGGGVEGPCGGVSFRGDTPDIAQADPPARGLVRPWRYRDPATIPRRQALYGGHYWRGSLSLTVAAPDIGKTSLAIAELCAIASGKPLLGQPVHRLKCFYFAGQDGPDETDRRIAAVMQFYGLDRADLENWLFTGDGRRTPFTVAEAGPEGALIDDWVVEHTVAFLRERRIDVAVFDPLRWLHAVDENSNSAMGLVAHAFERIATGADCSVDVLHHARKLPSGQEVEVGDASGGGALVAAARSVRTLNGMSKAKAKSEGIVQPQPFFRCDVGRSSFAPRSWDLSWYRLEDVALGNGDQVGVVTPYAEKSR
jgi:RecA-family ATPase